MGLVVTKSVRQAIEIGDVRIEVLGIWPETHEVRLRIIAPKEVFIKREPPDVPDIASCSMIPASRHGAPPRPRARTGYAPINVLDKTRPA